jgi:energy-coupling factor transporter transmembrane protein EcfT
MHAVHPLTKLYFTISVIILSFVLAFNTQLLVLLIVFLISMSVRQRWMIVKRLTRYVLPMVAFVLLLNVLFFPESQRTIAVAGFRLNEQGLMFGLGISVRLAILSLALLFLFTSTPPHLLSASLLMKGANPRIVYVFLHSIQLIQTLRSKIEMISISQASRGLQTKGKALKRLRAFFPLLLPLIFTYLTESLERGLALELRGLGVRGPKSFLARVEESRATRLANRIVIFGTILVVAWRIFQWLVP